MKYVRKVTAMVLSIIFCTAIVIGVGVIFSVKNVNVQYVDFSGKYTAEYQATKDNLNKLKGTGLLFLQAADIDGKISAPDAIAVASYERIFPCTVNVVLKERVECFAYRSGDGYALYDEDGVFLKNVTSEGVPLNAVDSCPDVLLVSADGREFVAEDFASAAELCAAFKEVFGEGRYLRRYVESVTFYGSIDTARINLRSGLVIALSDWKNGAEKKLSKAYDVYGALSDGQRVCGMITVADGVDGGEPTANYR